VRRPRVVSVLLVFVLAITVLGVGTASAAPGRAAATSPPRTAASNTSAATPATDDTQRPDRVSAQLLAAQSGHRVEVTSLRTETSTTYANPDGTFTADVADAPIRVQTPSGWQAIDPALVSDQSGVHPKAARANVRFSPGGTGMAANLSVGGKAVGFNWLSALPAPVLNGAVATYKDVAPGVDLELEALPSGYAERLVLRTRPATAPVFRLPLKLTGLTAAVSPEGRITLTDTAGKVVVEADPPRMWGATVDPNADEPTRVAPLTVRITGTAPSQVLEVAPDAGFLADPTVTYPVTVDPTTTLSSTGDTFVDSANPTTSFAGSTELKAGTYNDGGSKNRAFTRFDTSSMNGTHILSAQLQLVEKWSWSCTPSLLTVHALQGAFDTPTTWNTQPSEGGTVWASINAAHGHDAGCPADWVLMDVTDLVVNWARGSFPNYGIALRASETDNNGWKKFNSNQSSGTHNRLVVTYNSLPATPGSSMSPGGGAFLPTTTPTLKANFKDNDGGTGRINFEVYNNTTGALVVSGNGVNVHSVALSSWTVPRDKLVNGTTYKWRCRGFDGLDFGAWSVFKTFTIDTTAPAAPSVSSTQYPAGQWSGSSTTPGTFAFSDTSGDVASYNYGLDKTPPATNTTATSATLTPTDGFHRLYVQAVDRAGNRSGISEYDFGTGAGGVETPKLGDRTQRSVTVKASGKPTLTGVTMEWRRGDSDAWATVPAADVQSGGSTITWPVTLTGGVSPAMIWDVASTVSGEDGPVQVRANFSGTGAGQSTPVGFKLDQQRFGRDYAAENLGPGLVNVVTGNYELDETDVAVDAWGSDLNVGRVYNSRDPNASASGPFGPGWAANVTVLAANQDWIRLDDHGSYAIATASDSGITTFTKKTTGSTGTSYTSDPDAPELTLSSNATTSSPTPTQFDLTDTDGNITTFKKHGSTWLPETVKQANAAVTKLTWDASNRPAKVLAPIPASVSTTCATLVAGCRELEFNYATATTATGDAEGQWGDYAGQLQSVTFTAFDAAGVKRTPVVAQYLYDASGHLRAVWDPRISPALKTKYDYDTAGHITTITPPGELPWTITYAALPGESNTGRLQNVSRPALPSGTAVDTVTYRVPLSGTANGMTAPYPMSGGDTDAWAQDDKPVDATALFPPDQIPADPLAPTSFTRASVDYVDGNGRLVNTADPGGAIDVTEYDSFGNIIRELTPSNRACAVADTCTVESGVDPTDHAGKADDLDSHNVYSVDGIDLLESFGPTHLVTLVSGDQVAARGHTVTAYDEGAPSGGPYHLPTTITTGVRQSGATTDVDVRTQTIAYDDPTRPTTDANYHLGWMLRDPMTTTVDPGTGKLNLKWITIYSPTTGLPIETRLPATGSTADARRTKALYYTGDTSSGDTACNSKPQWANLLCKISPAAQPGTAGLPDLPVQTYQYGLYNELTSTTETVGSTTRTTTTTYDAADRPTDVAITSTVGTALPTVHTDYDPSTGRPVTTSTTDASGTATIIREFDPLGRPKAYHDADGNLATTSYDLLDRPLTTTDGKGTQTFTYDTTIEPRGYATSVADSAAGTFTARYDPDGAVTTIGYPNGLEARTTYDEDGNATQLTYVKTSNCTTDCDWLDFQVDVSAQGQWVAQASNLSSQDYTYDAAGRLATVEDTPADGGCTIRTYGYDADSNRTSTETQPPATDGSCNPTATGTTVTHSYDAADRLKDSGVTYDAFGRITNLPASIMGGTAVSASYFVNDMVRSLTKGSVTRTWTLDPLQRLRASTDTGGATGTRTNHYASDSDVPAWITEASGPTSWTRNIPGPSGGLAAIQDSTAGTVLQLTNLHGDVIAQASLDPTVQAPLATFDTDEFGVPRAATSPRYGWLGSKQRETDPISGLVLMGRRLYIPTLGRFLQVDPVRGGAANAYDYAGQDPINTFDLTGESVNSCGPGYAAGDGKCWKITSSPSNPPTAGPSQRGKRNLRGSKKETTKEKEEGTRNWRKRRDQQRSMGKGKDPRKKGNEPSKAAVLSDPAPQSGFSWKGLAAGAAGVAGAIIGVWWAAKAASPACVVAAGVGVVVCAIVL
jgi:RHS repeat-associated protein